MSMLSLDAQKREAFGKGANRRLRTTQLVPGVFYGQDGENVSIQMDKIALEKIYRQVRRTTVFSLEIDDNGTKTARPVIVWDVQYHPTKLHITHIDLYGVDLEKEVQITVPVEFYGVSKGAKIGGKIETYREEMRISAKPQHMPAKIKIDITDLDLNKTIRADDVALPEGAKVVYKSNYALISCLDPKGVGAKDDAGE